MKSFISEQFSLIKQNQKLVNEQSISDCQNNSELIKSLLDQTESLRRENSAKINIILGSLLNWVPYMLTCQRALRTYVPCVPTCSRA